jgi:ribose/xylose/arabinose/galactoside ABC-type transport system permease subunit
MTAIMPTTNLRPLPLNPARFALPALLVALVATATALQPSFLSGGNLQNILTQASPLLIVTMGQAVVMLVRGLDLSVASLMATMAVVATAFNASDDSAIPMIFAIVVVLSAIVGLANGLLVTRRKVSPFIATLAMMIVLQGLRFAYTKGAPAGSLPQGFRYLGAGRLWGFPVNLILFALLFAILWVVLSKTSLGRRIYIVGGNPRAAELVGLNSDRIMLVGYVGTVDNWVGRGYELDSIIAAVMGGVSLAGGAGGIAGATAGGLILILISNIVVILGLPVQAQLIIKGVIIVSASALFVRSQRRST